MKKPEFATEMTILWKDRKRTFLGLPWSFTKYKLTEEKLYVESGFFTSRQEETKLFRILDFSVTRTLGQKIFGLGTITMKTMDKTSPEIILKNIKYVYDVKELISQAVDKDRDRKNVTTRENFFSDDDDDDDLDVND